MKKFYLTQTLAFLSIFFLGILKINAQQVQTILPTNSGVDDAVFVSSDGTIYMSAFLDGIFSKYQNGVHTIIADTLGNSNGITEDSKGNIFVIDYLNSTIYKYVDSSGTLEAFNQGIPNPSGLIKMYDSDTLIATSYQRDSLYKIAPDGSLFPYLGGTPLDGPVGLAYDSLGTLYIGNFDGMEILKVHSKDSVSVVCTLPSNRQGFITYSGGYLYATVLGNHSIYKVNPDSGTYVHFTGGTAGHVDGHVDTARLNRPNGIFATSTGDTLYITEFNSQRLRMITGVLNYEPIIVQGIEKEVSGMFKFYPNPAKEQLFIDMEPGIQIQTLSIYDVRGVLVLRTTTNGFEPLKVQQLHSGMYQMVIETNQGVVSGSFRKD